MVLRTLRVPFNMETILMVIFTVIIVDASVREKPIQILRTLATAGLIREYQLEDRQSVTCATRHTSKPCYDSKLRNTCLTTTDSRSGFTECGWCPKGSCTTPGSAQCEPVNWLRQQGVTEFDTCLDPEAACARRHNTALCYEINDRIACLSTTDSRSDFFECGWCPDGPCTSPGSAQCEPVNWLREQGVKKFDTCLEPEDACENVRDNSGVKTCDYQLNKGGSSCIDYLKWGDCDFNCKLCPCSTSTGTSPQHCNGHGTCEATTCTKSTCTGVKCKCDPGWSGSKCEVCSVNDAVGDGSMRGTCSYGQVCNADGTCAVAYYSDLGKGHCVDSDNRQPFYCGRDLTDYEPHDPYDLSDWNARQQKAKCEGHCTSIDQCVAYEFGRTKYYRGSRSTLPYNTYPCQLIFLTKPQCGWFDKYHGAGNGGNSVSKATDVTDDGRCYKKRYD